MEYPFTSKRAPGITLAAVLVFFFAATLAPAYTDQVISGYTPVMIPCTSRINRGKLIALRHFSMNGRVLYLVVDQDTLNTSIEHEDTLVFDAYAPGLIFHDHLSSPYMTALISSTSPPYRLHNGGLRNFSGESGGAVLTVDLCPSKYGLSRYLFTGMMGALEKLNKPLPVAIAMSGKWIENHGPDIRWLQSLESRNRLSITWVNHSYSHPRTYAPSPRTLSKGFLLSKGVDFAQEVLLTEKRMIENNIVPSVFFRYPGLVSDGKLMEKLREFGLIALGCDAWLAKRERPGKGSIILVHANGHEPDGLKRFLNYLKDMKSAIARGAWRLLDLKDCTSAGFRVHHDRKVLPDRMAYRRDPTGTVLR